MIVIMILRNEWTDDKFFEAIYRSIGAKNISKTLYIEKLYKRQQ